MTGWRKIMEVSGTNTDPFNSVKPLNFDPEPILRVFRDKKDEVSSEDWACEAFEERAAIVGYGAGVPREWAEGYARLVTMARPGVYSPSRWQQIHEDGGRFLDRWAKDAARLGWDAAEVFGVGSDAPEVRIDSRGIVSLLRGWTVFGIAAGQVTVANPKTGNPLSIYRRADTAGRVLLWELEA